MVFGNRGARSSAKQQRNSEAFRPRCEALEPKVLLALLKLGAGTPQNIAGRQTTAPAGPQTIGGQLPFIADSSGLNQVQGNQTTDPGLGILETGNVASQGAGFSVAGLGDMNLDGSNDYLIGAPTVTQSGSVISPGTGTTSQAFLIFGNRSVTLPTTQSWLSATPEQRVGVLRPAKPAPAARSTHSRIAASPSITTLTGSPSSPARPPVHNSVPSSPRLAPTPSSSVLPTTPAAAVSTTSRPPRTSTRCQDPLRSTSTPPRLTRG